MSKPQYTIAQWPYKQPAVEGFDPQTNGPIDDGSDRNAFRRMQFLNKDPAVKLIEQCAADCSLSIQARDFTPSVAFKMDKDETRRPWTWKIDEWEKPGNDEGTINQLFALAFAQGFVPDFTEPWEFAGKFYVLPVPDPTTGVPFGFKFNS